MLREPLSEPAAEKLARRILEHGTVSVSRHGTGELAADALDLADATHVLRVGICGGRDLIAGTWRYRFEAGRVSVVVAFRSETELRIVTAWRKQR